MAKKPKQTKTPKESSPSAPKGVPSSWSLLRSTLSFIYLHKKKLAGVLAVFLVLYLLMVRASSNFDIGANSQLISNELGDNPAVNNLLLTGILLGSGGSSETGASSISTFLLFIIGSLAVIWAIRHLEAGKKFRVRDSYYKGMYPLIPFLLVVFLISIQLVPFAIGGLLYSSSEISGFITSSLERLLFVSAWIGLGLLSVYWLANSLMSIYAVTLPDIYPLQALRSTKQVVKGRRWSIFLKIFALGIFLLLIGGTLLFMIVITAPVVAVLAYDLFVAGALLITHVYLFKLYKSLL